VVIVGRVVVESAESVLPTEHPADTNTAAIDPARTLKNLDVRVMRITSPPHVNAAKATALPPSIDIDEGTSVRLDVLVELLS
jgi:hypothetical protein